MYLSFKVITAFEMLHANLPPTLAKSQVSSVRKHMKNQLLALLKNNFAAENYFTNITTLLTDLGASKEEVMRAIPRFEEHRKRVRLQEREKAQEQVTFRLHSFFALVTLANFKSSKYNFG